MTISIERAEVSKGSVMDPDSAESKKPRIRLDVVKRAGRKYYEGIFPDDKDLTDEELEKVIHYVPPSEVMTFSRRILTIPSRIARFIKGRLYTPTTSDYNPLDSGESPSRKVA